MYFYISNPRVQRKEEQKKKQFGHFIDHIVCSVPFLFFFFSFFNIWQEHLKAITPFNDIIMVVCKFCEFYYRRSITKEALTQNYMMKSSNEQYNDDALCVCVCVLFFLSIWIHIQYKNRNIKTE